MFFLIFTILKVMNVDLLTLLEYIIIFIFNVFHQWSENFSII